MSTSDRVQEMIEHYERGAVTRREIMFWFERQLEAADNDSSALQLCENLPSWFREQLTERIEELREANYFLRSTSLGETRTLAEIESDAKTLGELMKRLAPSILNIISSDH